jgi:hypothetical protein
MSAAAEILIDEKSVDRLAQKRDEALKAIDAARGNFRDACLAAEDGEIPTARKKVEASKKLESAEERLTEIEAALDAARRRDAEAKTTAADAERQRLWTVVEKHKAARAAAAKELEKSIAALRQAYERVVREGAAMLAASPAPLGRDGSITWPSEIEQAMRLELVRAGFTWAAPWFGGPLSIPAFVDRIASADAYIEKIRNQDGKD